jgi:hypothetical protein
MAPVASIAVHDRATGKPIEDLYVLCKGDHNGRALRIGRFLAPGGRMRLARNDVVRDRWDRSEDIEACECRVWADGYLPASHHLADLTHGPVTEFELERGESSTITGFVREGDRGVGSARISLMPTSNGWQEKGGTSLAIATTDSEGRFRIPAANGAYRLRIVSGSTEKSVRVDVPCPSPVDIDLSANSTIVVDVRDSSGVPREAVAIALRGLDGRFARSTSDSTGLARFDRLSPGAYILEVNHFLQEMKDTKRSPPNWPDQKISVELGVGERKQVDVVIPSSPRFAHLVVTGVESLVEWKACGPAGDWVDVESTGRIPLDIRGTGMLTITDPRSREWRAILPSDAPDGYVICIDLHGPGYEGVVTSRDTGQPIEGLRLFARPWNGRADSTVVITAVCDERGRFTLEGLANDFYYIRFEEVPRKGTREDIAIRTDSKPGSPRIALNIELPKKKSAGVDTWGGFGFEGFEETRISGVIRRAAGPPQFSGSSITSLIPRDGYTLLLWNRFTPNADGSFEVRVPVAPTYAAALGDAMTGESTYVEWNASGAADREVHDIEFP